MDDRTEQNVAPSATTLCDLPLEILDIILHKSYLHWILYSATKQRDEKIFRSLMSVDVCFYRRITRRWFKNSTLNYLKAFYEKTKKRSAIIRNNKNYLMENIKLSNELISSLLSLNCITLKESQLIQRRRHNRNKINELLTVMRSFDEEMFSNCVKCLRRINQKTVARIMENGGGVIRIQVHSCGEKSTKSIGTLQQLHQKIEDLRNKEIPWSHGMNRFIAWLSDEGIQILNSQLDRQTVVVWIWCRSQAALEYMERLYESNQLRDVFFEVIQSLESMIIDITRNQFKQTVVVCAISINLIWRIKILRDAENMVRGVTRLRNEIFILFTSISDDPDPSVIRVFEDRNAYHRVWKKIEINEIKSPWDIGSSEKDNCLYVSDIVVDCVWKITRETESDDEYKIIKWLSTDYEPNTLSVSSDGQLLVVDETLSILRIYGSDAELIRSIQLPKDIVMTEHAVKTSIGNFIISHSLTEEMNNKKLWGRSSDREVIISEKKDQKDKKEEEQEQEEKEVGKNNKTEEMKEIGRMTWRLRRLSRCMQRMKRSMEGTDKVDEKEMKEEESEWSGKKEEEEERLVHKNISVVSELTSDGQMAVRRFIPSNETQELDKPRYLSLDSDDQVFVADNGNARVILLDSDLKWNRILLSSEYENGEMNLPNSHALCYDDKNKQLIVVGENAIYIYSIVLI